MNYEYTHPLDEIGIRALAQALADEPARAIATGRSVLQRAEQITDVDYHAEMALAVAIAYFRANDPVRAFTYLDALRRAPLFLPIFYDLRPRLRRTSPGSARRRHHHTGAYRCP